MRKSPPIVHLDLARRDLQQIKNQLMGPACEGGELLLAESRLVDTSHQYHLWVIEEARYRLPFGFEGWVVPPHPIACADDNKTDSLEG